MPTHHRGAGYERLLRQETLILEATEAIAERMNAAGIGRSELAGRAAMHEQTLTNLLEGGSALTLRNLADVAHALGATAHVRLDGPGDERR